ncbi:hypothetical protein [Methanosarcina sp. KYL-1]|uniref:hypothetical protein n=1 Tax=Methanosarcina sp. KYL-1 TaxID=2602068 RepID=UPI002100ED40|nr:hypothetical protein [Methanosarcina sp. KYL-1]
MSIIEHYRDSFLYNQVIIIITDLSSTASSGGSLLKAEPKIQPIGKRKTPETSLGLSERITIDTPAGKMPVRTGFKLYEDGSIESVEPEEPVPVKTPLGSINA